MTTAEYSSGLYVGEVMHRRVKPRDHAFRYRMFMILFDLDELRRLGAGLRLFAHNRRNLLSFYDRDHLDGSARPLREQVEQLLATAGHPSDGGPIRLLCMPRLFGYVFNPLSIFFCHRRDGGLASVLYEVNNTFGQRHVYLIPVIGDSDGWIRQECAKCFYVSPFMDMGLTYDFRIAVPGPVMNIGVDARDAQGLLIATGFTGRRVELSDATLLRAFLTHPLMTMKVVAGIHWEALRIGLKGIKLRPRPPAPATPVTFVSTDEMRG